MSLDRIFVFGNLLTGNGNNLRMQRMTLNEKVTIYSAEGTKISIASYLKDILVSLPQAHELGLRLFKRNLKALYRQSLLGFAWALLPPVATAALWIFLRGNDVISVQ